MSEYLETLDEVTERGWAPPPDLSIPDWSDQNVVLGEDSPEPGDYRCSRTPYVNGIMEALAPTHPARFIALMKGSQVGGTRIGLNWLGYKIDQDPTSMIVTLPKEGVAKEWSSQRFAQLLDETERLRGKVADATNRVSGGGTGVFLKKIVGTSASIKFAWSTSASKLRSTPASDLLSDEVDDFEGDAEGQGDPIALLNRRFTNYPRGKHYMASTPTHDPSRIEREFKNGDQRYYFVPCPFCSHFQILKFRDGDGSDRGEYRLRWPQSVAGETREQAEKRYAAVHYVCVACGGQIRENHKTAMLLSGMWVATSGRPDLVSRGFASARLGTLEPILQAMTRATHVSFHLSALYSPLGWYKWAELARDWEAAQGSTQALKTFVNTVLGQVWRQKGDAPPAQKLYDRADETQRIGVVPAGGLLLLLSADIQEDRIEAEIKAWGRRGQNWSVYYEVIRPVRPDPNGNMVPCGTSSPEPYMRLAELLAQPWPHENGGKVYISAAAIDTGHNAEKVYAFCRKFPQPIYGPAGALILLHQGVKPTVVPVKGGASDWKLIEHFSDPDAAQKRDGLRVVTIGTHLAKVMVYSALQLDKPSPGEPYPDGYYHQPKYEYWYFQALTSEERIVQDNGRVVWKENGRNEPLDNAVYQLGLASMCGVLDENFPEEYWQELERRTRSVGMAPPQAPSAPPPIVAQQEEVQRRREVDDRQQQDSGGWIPNRKWF